MTPTDIATLQADTARALRQKIAERLELKTKLKESLEEIIANVERALLRVREMAQSAAIIARRTALEKQVVACQQEILREERECWRDIAAVEAQLREVETARALL